MPVVLVALLNTGLSSAITYNVTDLNTLPGDASSIAYGINDNGQIVGKSGAFENGNFIGRAFLYQAGSMLQLSGPNSAANGINNDGDVAGAVGPSASLYSGGIMQNIGALLPPSPIYQSSIATAVNAGDQVVGYRTYMQGEGFVQDAFLYSAGTAVEFHSLGLPNGSVAYGINTAGNVVGTGSSDTYFNHAFLYDGTSVHDLGTLGGPTSTAYGINDNGDVVGSADQHEIFGTNQPGAFLYSGGAMHYLGSLGVFPDPMLPLPSEALAINNSGEIVGDAFVISDVGMHDEVIHAFVYAGGTMTDLNTLIDPNSGWVLEKATALNDLGQIVGYGMLANGQTHAFLLTPVPEPATLILAVLGVSITCVRHARKRDLSIV
ncbi:MAG TPA: DUF3466 family protein [Pirellulales bacterium]